MRLTCPYCNHEGFYRDNYIYDCWAAVSPCECQKCGSMSEVVRHPQGFGLITNGKVRVGLYSTPTGASSWFERYLKETNCSCDHPLIGPDLVDEDGYICENCLMTITPQHEIYKKYKEYEV